MLTASSRLFLNVYVRFHMSAVSSVVRRFQITVDVSFDSNTLALSTVAPFSPWKIYPTLPLGHFWGSDVPRSHCTDIDTCDIGNPPVTAAHTGRPPTTREWTQNEIIIMQEMKKLSWAHTHQAHVFNMVIEIFNFHSFEVCCTCFCSDLPQMTACLWLC